MIIEYSEDREREREKARHGLQTTRPSVRRHAVHTSDALRIINPAMFISSNLVSTRVRVHRVNRIDRARFSFHRRYLRPLAASSFPLCLPVDPSFLAANREPRRIANRVDSRVSFQWTF